MSFPVKDISYMSSLTQQFNNLNVLILIALKIPIHVESKLLLQYVQTSHVDSGLSIAPIIFLCQVRSRFPYVLNDMSSLAHQQFLQSQWRVVFYIPIQTWIRLWVSYTWYAMRTMYVKSRLLLYCCVLYNHDDESCRLRLHLKHQLSIQRHACLWPFSPALGWLRPKCAHSSSIQEMRG